MTSENKKRRAGRPKAPTLTEAFFADARAYAAEAESKPSPELEDPNGPRTKTRRCPAPTAAPEPGTWGDVDASKERV